MANIKLDFSNNILFGRDKFTKTYTYRDIGTSNFRMINDGTNNKVIDMNTRCN
jgi:hypothetical protein